MGDNEILYISISVCATLLFPVYMRSKRFCYVNLAIFLIYNFIFHWLLFSKSLFGMSFSWWFYLLMLTWAQCLVLIIYLSVKAILSYINRHKS